MVIISVDPGCAIMGYDVVSTRSDKYRPTEYGTVTTQAGKVLENRLVPTYDSVCVILTHNRPDAVSIEKLYFTNSKTIAISVAEACGVIPLAVCRAGVPMFEYTPFQVKQAVTGRGQTKKPQVVEMTRELLCPTGLPKPDDTTDALVIAIYHGQAVSSPLRRVILSGGVG